MQRHIGPKANFPYPRILRPPIAQHAKRTIKALAQRQTANREGTTRMEEKRAFVPANLGMSIRKPTCNAVTTPVQSTRNKQLNRHNTPLSKANTRNPRAGRRAESKPPQPKPPEGSRAEEASLGRSNGTEPLATRPRATNTKAALRTRPNKGTELGNQSRDSGARRRPHTAKQRRRRTRHPNKNRAGRRLPTQAIKHNRNAPSHRGQRRQRNRSKRSNDRNRRKRHTNPRERRHRTTNRNRRHNKRERRRHRKTPQKETPNPDARKEPTRNPRGRPAGRKPDAHEDTAGKKEPKTQRTETQKKGGTHHEKKEQTQTHTTNRQTDKPNPSIPPPQP